VEVSRSPKTSRTTRDPRHEHAQEPGRPRASPSTLLMTFARRSQGEGSPRAAASSSR
jgi:hypothetical protein